MYKVRLARCKGCGHASCSVHGARVVASSVCVASSIVCVRARMRACVRACVRAVAERAVCLGVFWGLGFRSVCMKLCMHDHHPRFNRHMRPAAGAPIT